MNKLELKKFRDLLLKLRESIVGEVNHLTSDTLKKSQRDASGDLSGYSFHMADMATDNYERDFSTEVISNGQELLYRIDDALRKITEGTFSKCESCDKNIRKKRLRVMPYAKYCIDCQDKEEGKPH